MPFYRQELNCCPAGGGLVDPCPTPPPPPKLPNDGAAAPPPPNVDPPPPAEAMEPKVGVAWLASEPKPALPADDWPLLPNTEVPEQIMEDNVGLYCKNIFSAQLQLCFIQSSVN